MRFLLEFGNNYINPVMLKEIRQDLRSKSFLRFLFWSIILEALSVLSYAFMDSSERRSLDVAVLVWVFLLGGLLLFFPGRAWGTFSREERANSLELVLLTRLNGLQIAFGKWLSVIIQSILFFFALLPFIVFYYFSTHTPALALVNQLVILFLLSIMLSSFALIGGANSKGRHVSAFGGVVTVVLVLMLIGPAMSLLYYSYRSISTWSIVSIEFFVVLLVYSAITSMLMLLITASRICPIYENYAAAKRIVALIAVGITGLFLFTDFGETEWVLILSAIFLAPVCISACFEEPHPLLGLRLQEKSVTPWLTYSGWPQGMLLSAVLLLLYFPIISYSGAYDVEQPIAVAGYLFIGLVLPRALMLAMPRIFGKTAIAYVVIHTIIMLLSFVALLSEDMLFRSRADHEGLVSFVISANPLWVGIMHLVDSGKMLKLYIPAVTLGVCVIVILILLAAWVKVKAGVTRMASLHSKPIGEELNAIATTDNAVSGSVTTNIVEVESSHDPDSQ